MDGPSARAGGIRSHSNIGQVTINMLLIVSKDTLLAIFGLYLGGSKSKATLINWIIIYTGAYILKMAKCYL